MMKRTGLIGGISWHATLKYYQLINQQVNEHFGDNTNPPLLIYNINQSKMHQLQKQDDWAAIAEMVYHGVHALLQAGAETLVICSNTTHKVVPMIKGRVEKPILHIGDATAKYIISLGLKKVGFIGTRFAMEDHFLLDHIRAFEIDVLVPENAATILELHRIIHEELTYNKVTETSIAFVQREIAKMQEEGIEGVILGCTEYSLMFEHVELEIPVLDTVAIHAENVVSEILSGVEGSDEKF